MWRVGVRCWLFVGLCSCVARCSGKNVTVAVMLPDNHHKYAWALPRVLPALRMAQEDLARRGLLLGHTVILRNFSTENPAVGLCAESRAQVVAVDVKMNLRPDVFFGPGCVYPLASVGRFASHWRLPLFTAGGSAFGFDNQDEYSTIVRSGPSTTKLGEFAIALHAHFNWTSRAMVTWYDLRLVDDRPHYFLAEGIYVALKEQNITMEAQPYQNDHKYYRELISFIREHGRIIYICGPLDSFLMIMKLFQSEIKDPENYAIFYLDVFAESLTQRRPWLNADPDWADPIQFFKSVFVITYRPPDNPEYQAFQKELHARTYQEFGVHLEPSLMDLIAGSFYDGFLLYAMALQETLADGGAQNDGINITMRTANRSFWGVTGMVTTDEKNARNTDLSLWAMTNQETGEYGVVANYNGSTKGLVWSQTERITWPSGGPPLDNPPCVFSSDDPSCNDDQLPVLGIVAVGSGLALIIFGISSFLIYSALFSKLGLLPN